MALNCFKMGTYSKTPSKPKRNGIPKERTKSTKAANKTLLMGWFFCLVKFRRKKKAINGIRIIVPKPMYAYPSHICPKLGSWLKMKSLNAP